MIYGFYLTRFRYGPLSAASRCSAVIRDEHKTLTISNQDEANAFPAQNIPLDAISSICFGRGPCSIMLDILPPKVASGRASRLFIELQRSADRSSFYSVLQNEIGDNLRTEENRNGPFSRWEDNIPEPTVEELETELAVKETEIGSLRGQLAATRVGLERDSKVDSQRRYQLDDMLPFQISQVLRVVNAYERNNGELQRAQGELVQADDQMARRDSRIAALVVALMNPDAVPAILSEKDLQKYLASSSIGLLPDEIAALNDNEDYKKAIA